MTSSDLLCGGLQVTFQRWLIHLNKITFLCLGAADNTCFFGPNCWGCHLSIFCTVYEFSLVEFRNKFMNK